MRIKKIISCVLCAALLLTFLPAPAHAVTLTAVNDSILPLDESTMPARLGGETYVPYSVFTTLGVSAPENDGVLDLSANDETLSFSTAEGYVYDQNLNSYSTPAYEMNGTVYVPVKLCCAKFGFTYSSLTLQGENVLRVADGSAQSDSAFIAAHTKVIENTIDNYKGSTSGSDRSNNTNTNPAPAKPVDNDTIEIPKVEEKPAKKPVRVYLAYYGAPNENTAAVLDNLHDAGRQAAFFLPTDTSEWDDDLVRRIAAEGHTAAFLLQADSKTTGADMLADLAAANERLTLLTGVAARIAANQSGSDALTEAQRSVLIGAGYRLWDAGLDSGDAEKNAAEAYTQTVQYFASTSGVVIVRLHHSKATPRPGLEVSGSSYIGIGRVFRQDALHTALRRSTVHPIPDEGRTL